MRQGTLKTDYDSGLFLVFFFFLLKQKIELNLPTKDKLSEYLSPPNLHYYIIRESMHQYFRRTERAEESQTQYS